MPKTVKYLLIGSTEPYSGKSATVLGLFHQLQQRGLDINYGKPLGNFIEVSPGKVVEQDVHFITQHLNLESDRVAPTLISSDAEILQKRLKGEDNTDYQELLRSQYGLMTVRDLTLLEGAGNLEEGCLFGLSLAEVAHTLDAAVLLVTRYRSLLSTEALFSAKQRLGDRLIGTVINDVPKTDLDIVNSYMRPFLEAQHINVLGILPSSDLLRSLSVEELVSQLNAEVLCRSDRLDLMVESLAIGAMNVNAAVKYFRKRRNMAVVTGGDRVEIQQAALETSTQCLILTGQLPPPKFILNRAEELEIPILSVDLDTLTTVEIIDKAFGKVRLHEPIKVDYIRQLMGSHFEVDKLLSLLR